MRINMMRLALSLGIVGAVILPIRTKSFHQFGRETTYEDDQTRFLAANGMNDYDCIIMSMPGERPPTDAEKAACSNSENIRGQHRIYTSTYHPSALLPLARDILVGFLGPFLVVLLVPKFARAYWGWLTR